MKKKQTIHLGCGLIGIGREWGHKKSAVPTEQDVLSFLHSAYDLGIRYFDTAPSYGTSEERLGKFLRTLSQSDLDQTIIATKFGEHWDTEKQAAYVDHRYEALIKSIDQSLLRLPKIDILYLHKTSPQVLESKDLRKAMEYAATKGIQRFGASVSDIESAETVCDSDHFSVIQFPYNTATKTFAKIIDLAKQEDKTVVINRPFNMGASLYDKTLKDPFKQKVEAYKTILMKNFSGYILTGTKDSQHLQENLKAFQQAQSEQAT